MTRRVILPLFLLAPFAILAQEDGTAPTGYTIEGRFDAFTTDEMGNVYALQGDELRLFDARGRSWLRNSVKTFGQITVMDAFYSLKPMLFAREQGQLALLDNTLSLNGSVVNLSREDYVQVVGVCMSVQNCFWFFDQREMALVRVDNQLNELAHSGRLDQVLGFTVEPAGMMEYDSKLYLNDPKHGILVFDVFGTYVKTIGIKDARCIQVRGQFLYFLDAMGAHIYDMLSFAVQELRTEEPADKIRDLRVENGRVHLLLEDRILVHDRFGTER